MRASVTACRERKAPPRPGTFSQRLHQTTAACPSATVQRPPCPPSAPRPAALEGQDCCFPACRRRQRRPRGHRGSACHTARVEESGFRGRRSGCKVWAQTPRPAKVSRQILISLGRSSPTCSSSLILNLNAIEGHLGFSGSSDGKESCLQCVETQV